MKFLIKPLSCLALLLVSLTAHCATWEEADGQFFINGDLKAVKRILSKEKYSGDQLALAFNFASASGNVALTQYLESLGWIKACEKLSDNAVLMNLIFNAMIDSREYHERKQETFSRSIDGESPMTISSKFLTVVAISSLWH